ncbi:hypothetical protein ACP70R_027544 [Stipagrostis hirtigluma subsp. patula]
MAMVMESQQPVAQVHLQVPPPPPPPPPMPPQAYKHHCKVCRKGFMCGRALGGHMRAHGVADDVLSADDDGLDDDESGPCGGGGGAGDSSEAASPSATTKRMYALRANPGRLKSCRVCENCGKEFTSWKSLLDHGRCNYDEEEDLNGSRRPSPPSDEDDGEVGEEEEDLALAAGWSKGKRTRRAKVMVVGNGSVTEVQLPAPSSEEEDLANCLVMLSSSRSAQPPAVVDADQESCASASKGEERARRLFVPQPISMVPPALPQLKLLAPPQVVPQPVSTVPRGMFECKACKKVFTSHQALGGHRASHKKVKGCFAAKLESNRSEPQQLAAAPAAPYDNPKAVADAMPDIIPDAKTGPADASAMSFGGGVVVMATAAPEMAAMPVDEAPAPSAGSPFKKKGKVHECSICHRVFMSGQALGGHKRCHWLTTGASDPMTGAVAKFQPLVAQDHVMHAMCQQLTLGRQVFDASDPILDLNVPTNPSAEPAVATRQAAELNDSALCLNAPASLYMQSWTGHSNGSNVNRTATSSRNDAAGAAATEDEADSTSAKRAKISDLKDMNVAGETSWLQVGIGLPSESKEKGVQ